MVNQSEDIESVLKDNIKSLNIPSTSSSLQSDLLSSPEIPNKDRRNKLLLLTVFILIVGAFLLLGSALPKLKNTNKTIQPTPFPTLPQITLTPSPIPDSTAGWKTYISQKYGFQMNYPSGWLYQTTNEPGNFKSTEKTHIISFSPTGDFEINPGVIEIRIFSPEEEIYLKEFIENYICPVTYEGPNCESIDNDDTEFSINNKITAKKIIYHPRVNFAESIIFKYKERIIEIELDFEKPYGKPASSEEKRSLFNQILSTFRFLDNPVPNQSKLTLKGTLTTMERPAADIAYDYQIILDEPLYDELNATGNPWQTSVIVTGLNSQIEQQFKQLVGQRISVRGALYWGYAESRPFEVQEIVSL